MQIVVFEDSQVETLFPITLTRPAFQISCGGFTLLEMLSAFNLPIRTSVRSYLQNHEPTERQIPVTSTATLLVNARLVACRDNMEALQRRLDDPRQAVVRCGSSIAAAMIPNGICGNVQDVLSSLETSCVDNEHSGSDQKLSLLEYPHDVVRIHVANFAENLNVRLARSEYQETQDGVFVHPQVDPLCAQIVFDTQCGPILIDEGVKIRPFCFLRGPLHLSRNVRVNEHSSIKDNVFVGTGSKIGGEIEEVTIESFSNKQHHGFLGHSYVGSWVNLGAGTCNSDLKNTYGEIRMDYPSGRVATGMQFMGCIIGDYTKSAINTSIFTGKTIGACSTLYGYVTQNVPSFVNYAQSFGQITDLPAQVIIDMQKRMFDRRNLEQTVADIQLIEAIYARVSAGRELADGPPTL